MVGDTILGESVTDKIKVKVASTAAPVQPENGVVTVNRSESLLRESPTEAALVVARAAKGTGFRATGRVGNFTRVELEKDRFAFVAASDVSVGGTATANIQPVWQVMPPVLTVSAPTQTTGISVHIRGNAVDDHEVKDLYVRVWNRDSKLPWKKAFYLPNRSGDRTKLSFEADVPLWPGSNLIQVFARETNEVQTVQTVVVLDRATNPNLVKVESGGNQSAVKQ
jgi:carboxyl-terminal processing protease